MNINVTTTAACRTRSRLAASPRVAPRLAHGPITGTWFLTQDKSVAMGTAGTAIVADNAKDADASTRLVPLEEISV